MKNTASFKAPQRSLKTSWIEMAFSKPKKGALIVRKSLSNRSTPVVTYLGQVKLSSGDNSY